jgi:hypothetical protein
MPCEMLHDGDGKVTAIFCSRSRKQTANSATPGL